MHTEFTQVCWKEGLESPLSDTQMWDTSHGMLCVFKRTLTPISRLMEPQFGVPPRLSGRGGGSHEHRGSAADPRRTPDPQAG